MSKPGKFWLWSVLLTIIFIEVFVLVSPASASVVISSVNETVQAVIHPAPAPKADASLQPVAKKLTCPLDAAPRGLGYYPVHDGETAQSIADTFHISAPQVITLNPGASFHSGEIIYLPAVEGTWNPESLCSSASTMNGPAAGGFQTTPTATSVAAVQFIIPKGNPQCPLPPAGRGIGYYPIHKGETLQDISKKFRVPVETIRTLNPNSTFARGQILVLPAAEGPWDNGALCPENVSYLKDYQFGTQRRTCPLGDPPRGFGYYKIVKGDTPLTIAKKFRVPLDTILILNQGYSFARGSILLLPAVEGPWNNGILCP